MRIFLIYIGRLFSYMYPFSLHVKIYNIVCVLYTGWLTRGIKSLGDNSKFGMRAFVSGLNNVEIGDNVYMGKGMGITAEPTCKTSKAIIVIGDNSMFGDNNHITACNGIIIGCNLRTGRNVLISDNSHGNPRVSSYKDIHPNERPLYSKGKILIGNNVWIGSNSCVLSGVTLGDGVIVGANTVVTHSFPNGSVVSGCPAKII